MLVREKNSPRSIHVVLCACHSSSSLSIAPCYLVWTISSRAHLAGAFRFLTAESATVSMLMLEMSMDGAAVLVEKQYLHMASFIGVFLMKRFCVLDSRGHV